MLASFFVALLAAASAVTAQSTSAPTATSTGSPTSTSSSAVPTKTVYIQVSTNQTATNGTQTFQPRQVVANVGDTVIFNFTLANHTATQSTFDNPCIPAFQTTYQSSAPINGFNSDWRNGSSSTILSVPITPDLENKTLWFYDAATCYIGGVGGINVNESNGQTLAGFVRNALRLNGTKTSTSSSRSPSATGSGGSSPSSTGGGSGDSSSAERTVLFGALAAAPLVLAALAAL